MTKKRLSDLLRHEVEKSADEEDPNSQKGTAASSAAKAAHTSATASNDTEGAALEGETKPLAASQAKQAEHSTEAALQAKIAKLEAHLETAQQQESALKGQIVNLKADLQQHEAALQAKIAELEANLETAHQQETALQQQIVNLKADLQQQIDLSTRLTANLEQAKEQGETQETQLARVTAELAEAKKVILQLSEANAKPLAKPHPRRDQTARKLIQAKPQRVSLKPLPRYCIQPEPKPTTLSDDDIGWVD